MRALLAPLVTLWALPALAAPLGLRGAIAAAVRSNPTLGMKVADVEAAAGEALAARGLEDFVLDAAVGWSEGHQVAVAGIPVQQPVVDEVRGAVGLSRLLPTGGRLGLRLSHDYVRGEYLTGFATPTQLRTTTEVWSPALQLTLTQPLLRGAGSRYTRAPRRRAEVAYDAASLGRVAAACELLRQVVAAYWELSFASQELTIRRQAATQAREQLAMVRANIEVGKAPPSASAEVEVALALREDDAIAAEQAQRESALLLARLFGRDLDEAAAALRVDLIEALSPAPRPQAVLADLAHNPALAAAAAQRRRAEIDVQVARQELRPALDLSAAGGPTGSAASPAQAWSQLGHLRSWSLQAGLTLTAPLGNRVAAGNLTRARAAATHDRLAESDVRAAVQADALRLLHAVTAAAQRIERLRPSIAAARRDLEAERARFAAGRGSNFDVLRRQDEVAAVQLREARARTDYEQAVAGVQALTGAILPRYGVVLR